jgi:hypothetical protein
MYRAPKDAINDTFLSTIVPDRRSLGVVMESLSDSQFAYELLYNLNEFVEQDDNVEVAIFSNDTGRPHFIPVAGLYDMPELFVYTGHVLSDSPELIHRSVNKYSGVKGGILFIYDVHRMRRCELSLINELLADDRILLACRSESQKKYIQHAYNTNKDIDVIEDVDIKRIIQLMDRNT